MALLEKLNIDSFIKSLIGGVTRSLLGAPVGWLVAKGYITSSLGSQMIVTATATICLVIWSLWQKYHVNDKIEIALGLPQGTSRPVLEKVVEELKEQERLKMRDPAP